MHRTLLALASAAVLLSTGSASAQDDAWGQNGYISLNGMYDVSSRHSDVASTPDINNEPAHITTTQTIGHKPVYDVTVGGRVKGHFGVGFGFAYEKNRQGARIGGTVPHPFYFDQPRTLDGSTTLERTDMAVHIHAMWLLPLTETLQMTVFGGPTWFNVNQQAVKTVGLVESYPYDTVALGDVTTERQKGSRFGANAGFDLSFFFNDHLGIQGLVRYAQGTVKLTSGSATSSVDAGGLQVGAGLRIRY